jgi:hypothetical protein
MKSMIASAVAPTFKMVKVPLVAAPSTDENAQSSRQMRMPLYVVGSREFPMPAR